MNGSDQAVSFIYILLLLVLVGSALAARRIPIGQGLKMAVAWTLIFLVVIVAFALKDDFADLGKRVVAEVRGEPRSVEGSATLRIAKSLDGHFWASAKVNGANVRFLVDSGATVTSISTATAREAGIAPNTTIPAFVETANGTIRVQRARADRIEIGSIQRENLAVHISDADDVDVLGMNFLSSLSSWGVEGRWLVLKP
jgi:aspartyl protease family protein